MTKHIKYVRKTQTFEFNNYDDLNKEIQDFFDDLIINGYQIIYYKEKEDKEKKRFKIVVVLGKINDY